MDLENMFGLMEKLTKDNGKMARGKDMANFFGKNRDNFIMDSTKMISSMEKELSTGI